MEENSGSQVADSSGHGNSLSLVVDPSKPAWTADAPVVSFANDYSLHFDGTNDFAVGQDLPDVDSGDKLTVEAWIKPGNLQKTFGVIAAAFQNGYATQWAFLTDASGYGLQVTIASGPQNWGVLPNAVSTVGNYLQAGQWAHVAFVYNGAASRPQDMVKIFINGQRQVVASAGWFPTQLQPMAPVVKIGAEPSSFNPFEGNIDEVKIYNVARTDADIAADAAGAAPVFVPLATSTPTATPATTPDRGYAGRLLADGRGIGQYCCGRVRAWAHTYPESSSGQSQMGWLGSAGRRRSIFASF